MTGQGFPTQGPAVPVDLGIPGISEAVEIGRGGFGIVYRAARPGYDQSVAVKVLAAVHLDPQGRTRFEREVRAMGSLFGHPHIVGIITAGYTASGQPYIVMEDMVGGSLADSLRARGRFPWEEAVSIGLALADALGAAHAQHVLHRDIKPENVLYSRYRTPKLGDFGIASLGDGAETRSAALLLSLAHTAPEVLDGEPRTPSSDVYAVGSTVVTLMLGQPPFARRADESTQSLFKRIATAPPPDLRGHGVPDPVCRVLEQAMAKLPEHRYVTAKRFRDDLAEAVATARSAAGATAVRRPTVGWRLSIDFGTTYTAAAVEEGGRTSVLTLEGDGSHRVRSAVWLDDSGRLLVGAAAINQCWLAPERFEPTPKRLVGQAQSRLGDTPIPVVAMVAAVLQRVVEEATRQHGGEAPVEARLTHPAGWSATRNAVLVEAARQAGLGSVKLIPEPVAAAAHLSRTRGIEVGQHLAVYDLGGGTFDAAVLRRTDDGFEVAGPPGGKDPMGGEEIDHRIIDHLGAGPVGQQRDWHLLLDPPDTLWRQRQADLFAWVRRAKEALSTEMAFTLMIPGLDLRVQLTRAELEDLVRADIEETVEILHATIVAAGISPNERDLAGIFLVGGSSRMPLVAETIWRRLGRRADTQDDPKSVVALGGASWGTRAPQTSSELTETVIATPAPGLYPVSSLTPRGGATPAFPPPPPGSPPPSPESPPPPPGGPPAAPPPGSTATVVVPVPRAAVPPAWGAVGGPPAPSPRTGGDRGRPAWVPHGVPSWLARPVALIVAAAVVVTAVVVSVVMLATTGGSGDALGDPCLVGTWVSQSTSSISLTGGGGSVTLNGGAGGVLTFSADGRVVENMNGADPYQGTYQGVPVELRLSGGTSWIAHAAAPSLATSHPEGSLSISDYVGGTEQWTRTVPAASGTNQYSCTATTLTMHNSTTSQGITMTVTGEYAKG